MKHLLIEIKRAALVTIVLAVVCCGIYPLVVFGIGQTLFRDQANGSLIVDSTGTVRGSKLIGQQFSADNYFHSRPSAAGANGYDGANSSGSNLGPTSKKLHDAIQKRIIDYRKLNSVSETVPVPADAVTTSGSGLDPHISLQNATLQLPRVAKARGRDEATVRALLQKSMDEADLNFLGEPGVNVLKLNMALDALQ